MGQQTTQFTIVANGKSLTFKAKQLPPRQAMLVQMKLQKDLAPLMFSFLQEIKDIDSLPMIVKEAIGELSEDTLAVLFDDMLFASEIVQVGEKLVPLDEGLFTHLFGGDLLASWELLIQVLLLNFKSFILALPEKIQALTAKGVKKPA